MSRTKRFRISGEFTVNPGHSQQESKAGASARFLISRFAWIQAARRDRSSSCAGAFLRARVYCTRTGPVGPWLIGLGAKMGLQESYLARSSTSTTVAKYELYT
eukprot:COSAG01_NODE_45646_length_407_cov_1.542208_1_plen_103_part_10